MLMRIFRNFIGTVDAFDAFLADANSDDEARQLFSQDSILSSMWCMSMFDMDTIQILVRLISGQYSKSSVR